MPAINIQPVFDHEKGYFIIYLRLVWECIPLDLYPPNVSLLLYVYYDDICLFLFLNKDVLLFMWVFSLLFLFSYSIFWNEIFLSSNFLTCSVYRYSPTTFLCTIWIIEIRMFATRIKFVEENHIPFYLKSGLTFIYPNYVIESLPGNWAVRSIMQLGRFTAQMHRASRVWM